MNVILYVLYSLRADVLTPYDGSLATSPNLADLAADSLVVEQAFSNATWTRPSGASLLSGVYPSVHNVKTIADRYPSNLPTIAAELQRAGFTTVGISAMGNISSAFGFDKGFDEFHELYKHESVRDEGLRVTTEDAPGWRDHFDTNTIGVATGADVNRSVERTLKEHDDVFVFVWSLDTHDPYFHRDPDLAEYAPVTNREPLHWQDITSMNEAGEREYLKNLYFDMVRYADIQLGTLVDMIKEQDRYDETMLVVTGDHGEAFGEHGMNSHGGYPYEEQIRVPLIVKYPNGNYAGRMDRVTELVDLYPSILDIAGVDPENRWIQGSVLHDDGDGRAFIETDYVGHTPAYYCLRTTDRKYVRVHPPRFTDLDWTKWFEAARNPGTSPRDVAREAYNLYTKIRDTVAARRSCSGITEHFYDLNTDSDEQNPDTERTAEMSAIAKYVENIVAECEQYAEDIEDGGARGDAATREQLASLGYLDR